MRGVAERTCCLASIQAGLTGPAGWEDTPSFHAFSSSTVPGVSSAAGIRGEDTREARGHHVARAECAGGRLHNLTVLVAAGSRRPVGCGPLLGFREQVGCISWCTWITTHFPPKKAGRGHTLARVTNAKASWLRSHSLQNPQGP